MVLGAREGFRWFRGSTTSTTVAGAIPFADPLAALEVALASEAWHGTLMLGAAAVAGLTLLLGPVFCGWLCPLGLLLDLNQAIGERISRLLSRGGIRRRDQGPLKASRNRRSKRGRRFPPDLRFLLLGGFLGFAWLGGLPLFQLVSPINLVAWSAAFFSSPTMNAEGSILGKTFMVTRSLAAAGGGMFLVFLAVLILEHAFPRAWCRTLCPAGALYSLLGRWAPWRVRIRQPSECGAGCGRCTVRCPMGIEVTHDFVAAGKAAVDHPDCTRCGACLDECPKDLLQLRFGVRT